MTKTITSLFHSGQHAATAASRLEQAGIPRSNIDIWSAPINLAPLLEDAGVSRADAHAYAEGVRYGGSVIIVTCADEEADRVVRILDDEGRLDLEEHQAASRSEEGEETGFDEAVSELTRVGHGRARIQPGAENRPA